MSIKIIGQTSLASDLYVKMGQVIQEIDIVTVCKAGDEIVGHLPRNISTMYSIFIWRGGIIYCTVSRRRQYSRDLTQGGIEIQKKLLKNFHDWRLIRENHKRFALYGITEEIEHIKIIARPNWFNSVPFHFGFYHYPYVGSS